MIPRNFNDGRCFRNSICLSVSLPSCSFSNILCLSEPVQDPKVDHNLGESSQWLFEQKKKKKLPTVGSSQKELTSLDPTLVNPYGFEADYHANKLLDAFSSILGYFGVTKMHSALLDIFVCRSRRESSEM